MADDPKNNISDLVAAPIGALIAAVGRGVAEAQQALDQHTIDTLQALSDAEDGKLRLMRQLGYQPTWYRIPEVEAEMTLSLSIGASGESSDGAPLKLYGATVDATYANKYGYNLQAASTVRFKVVPVPATVNASEVVLVPNLKGKTLDASKKMLDDLGIPWEIEGSNDKPSGQLFVKSSNPAAGEVLRAKKVLVLTVAK